MLPRPVPPRSMVTWGSALAVLGAAVIWWQPGSGVTVLGPALTVLALAVVATELVLTRLAPVSGSDSSR